jgi:hypothetical protein
MTTQIQPVSTTPQLEIRLDRLKVWHSGAKASAARLKLFVFLAGAEIMALKTSLGVSQGGDQRANGNGFRLLDRTYATWEELVANESGMTARTTRNYATAYLAIAQELPEIAQRILASVDIALASPEQDQMSLQLRCDEHFRSIRPADLEAFAAATDPWTLGELYRRELKPAEATEVIEAAKQKAAATKTSKQLEFWFGEVADKIKSKEYLRFPRDRREMLLDELELAVRELKDSLKGSAQ